MEEKKEQGQDEGRSFGEQKHRREEEERGNSIQTYPDLMGPFPHSIPSKSKLMGKEEQRPPDKDDAP